MPTLAISDFNIVCAVLGGFVLTFGLVSYFVKERLYLSEALIALVVGIALGPHGANLIRPLRYAEDNTEENLDAINLAFCRLVLGVQLVLAGVQLPKKYLIYEWKSLAMLLGPIMTCMWIVSGSLIYAFIPGLSYLQCLAIGACITPTDPILSNTIVKGKFADKHIPQPLQRIIIAESGANDGLGYPFLFLALYIYRYSVLSDNTGHGISLFFTETCGYIILLSVAYGTVVGWLAKELLHWASERRLVDRESFLVFAVALALFTVGSCGMIGTDDVLACFIAGNVFTLDDWFRLETMDDSLQPTIDMLLNITIFLWFGAVAPWYEFAHTPGVPIGRLVGMGICILLLRRPPVVMLLYRAVPRMKNLKEALFAGYFGPIGVSAVFYLFITLEFLTEAETLPLSPENRTGIEQMITATRLVVWFAVISSVIVHGITVPVIKLGNSLPISLSLTNSVSRMTDNFLPGLGTRIISRSSSRSRERPLNENPTTTPLSTSSPPNERIIQPPVPTSLPSTNPNPSEIDVDIQLPSTPASIWNFDGSHNHNQSQDNGKKRTLVWDDDNLERGRARVAGTKSPQIRSPLGSPPRVKVEVKQEREGTEEGMVMEAPDV